MQHVGTRRGRLVITAPTAPTTPTPTPAAAAAAGGTTGDDLEKPLTIPDADLDGFANGFIPDPAVDYKWVVAYARDRWSLLDRAYDSLDAKAATVLAYLGGGTGLFTAGAVAAVADGKVGPVTALAVVPAAVAAVLSLRAGILARHAAALTVPPSVRGAIRYAESCSDTAEAAFLGQWHRAVVLTEAAVEQKAARVNLSLNRLYAALILLQLPFLYVVATKLLPGLPR